MSRRHEWVYGYLYRVMPDCHALTALPPEELGALLLGYLHEQTDGQSGVRASLWYESEFGEYPNQAIPTLKRAMAEAVAWLRAERRIITSPGQADSYVELTTLGVQLHNPAAVEAYRQSRLLPKELLHPAIAAVAWSHFQRGEYDTAILRAMKQIEIAVRQKGGYPAEMVGTRLMAEAFHPQSGALTFAALPTAEREGMRNLFSGAIGLYKNPHSHRDVGITDAADAIGPLLLASQLHRLVDLT